uniref:Uncharacterized protein n=1 Tax=Acrobeloides nanus TaxID=290746 RepID=A0A914DPD3_9BILA
VPGILPQLKTAATTTLTASESTDCCCDEFDCWCDNFDFTEKE